MYLDEHLPKQIETNATATLATPPQPMETTPGTATSTHESQLFTPTMEKVLGEASDKEVAEQQSSSSGKGVKRQIQFGTVGDEDLNPQGSQGKEAEADVIQKAGTPTKKSKDKATEYAD